MSIVLAAGGMEGSETANAVFGLVLILWSVFAVVAALYVFGALRPRNVLGPLRLRDGDPALPLVFGLLAAALPWVVLPLGYVLHRRLPAGKLEELLHPLEHAALAVVPGLVGFFAGILVLVFTRRPGARRLGLGLRDLWPGFRAGLVGILVVLPLVTWTSVLSEFVWKRLGKQHEPAHEMLQSLGSANGRLVAALLIVAATVVAPLFEELLFRGFLQSLLVRAFGGRRTGPPAGFPVAGYVGAPPAYAGPYVPVYAQPIPSPAPPPPPGAQAMPSAMSPPPLPSPYAYAGPAGVGSQPPAYGVPISAPPAPPREPIYAPGGHLLGGYGPPPPPPGVPLAAGDYPEARPVLGRWMAIFATSLLFAAVHPWWTQPPIFFLSVWLGYAYERTGKLWAPIFMHALFNGTSVVLYLFLKA